MEDHYRQSAFEQQQSAQVHRRLAAEAHKDLAAALGGPKAGFQVAYAGDFDPTNPKSRSAHAAVSQGVNFVHKLLCQGDGGESTFGNVAFNTMAKRGSFHFGEDGKDVIESTADTATAVHELGHLIESRVPGAKEAAREFLAHRVGSEQEAKMTDVHPGAGYGEDETGRRDDFGKVYGDSPEGVARSYYAGKEYPDGSTEILSMGIEQLFKNPAAFMRADPEWAKFVIGILSGAMRHNSP